MPIYEYYCSGCRQEFSLMRPMSQAGQPAPCPQCGAPGEKLVSVFASKANYQVFPPTKDAFRGSGS